MKYLDNYDKVEDMKELKEDKNIPIDENLVKESTNNSNHPKKKTSSKVKYIINILLVVGLTVVAILISLGQNFNESFRILGTAKWQWVLVLVGLMVGMALINALILFFFARLYTRNYKYHQALAVYCVGNFYSAVTPGATGGEVMQAYIFKKQGIHVSSAVSMLAMFQIVYQTCLIVFGIVSFIVKYPLLNEIRFITINLGAIGTFDISIWILTIIGFLLNLGVILIVFLMSYWHGLHNFIIGPCVSFLTKIHLVHKPDEVRENLRIQVENFKIEFKRLLTNIPFTILITILVVFFMIIKFSLPYFCGLALDNQGTGAQPGGFWDAVFLSNYHQMVTGLIPLPGSAGVSEYFFTQLFVDYNNLPNGFYHLTDKESTTALCSAALLLWRTFSFTLPLFISAIVTAFYHATPSNIEKEEDMPSRKTYVAMQSETLVSRQNDLNMTIGAGKNILSKEAILNKLKLSKKTKKSKKNENKRSDFDAVDINVEDEE